LLAAVALALTIDHESGLPDAFRALPTLLQMASGNP
jgi:hypothetical protein